jgi:hypothetical protein
VREEGRAASRRRHREADGMHIVGSFPRDNVRNPELF